MSAIVQLAEKKPQTTPGSLTRNTKFFFTLKGIAARAPNAYGGRRFMFFPLVCTRVIPDSQFAFMQADPAAHAS
jgi:hypothetical protein